MSQPDKGGARLMKNQHKCRELAPLLRLREQTGNQ